MGNRQTVQQKWAAHDAQFSEIYDGAGCMFVGNHYVLAGTHRDSNKSTRTKISGFGGKSLEGEHWRRTAFRETVEEFFHIQQNRIPEKLLHDLEANMIPSKILSQLEGFRYLTLVFCIKDLPKFLGICKKHLKQSPMYLKFPTSAFDLAFHRISTPFVTTEISHILLWPRELFDSNYYLDANFVHDLLA